MNYVVVELQTNDGVTANIVTSHDSLASAESKFHTVLAAAAISNVEEHAAVLLTSEGFRVDSKCYKHGVDERQE